jgi:LuxR family maltose regulon positive regulatory protein
MLATRHDLRLGLHRLRVEGELTEIRTADLRLDLDEARMLLHRAGVILPEPALALLVDRTEGWAAGLRLAAQALAGHPDPEGFAAEFSGSERTVAEYLLAEVLERQPEDVRLMLRRTSMLERVSGPLADLLAEGTGGERILHELEAANAFVVSVDPRRSWFRYHRLFCDLLQLELRRTEPAKLSSLHHAAAEWYAQHGYPAEANQHAQAAQDPNFPGTAAPVSETQRRHEPLSDSETRVLRYLPTNLPAPKIASELSVSVNTVRTHLYHLYAKLGAHSRAEAVDRARALGLLTQSSRGP